jgi:hypothetical protein
MEAKMNTLRRNTRWLVVAAMVLVGQTLVLFILGPSFTKAASIAVAVLFASLMWKGSRFAWTVVLIGAVGQFVSSAIETEYFSLAAGGVVVLCLLAPASVRFVWTRRPNRGGGRPQPTVKRGYEKVKTLAYGFLSRVAEWENGALETDATDKQRSYRLLIWRLGVVCLLLLVLVGLTYNWQHGSGRESPVVSVIANLTWTFYALVQLAFIAVTIVAVYQHFASSRIPSKGSRSEPK